MSGRHEVSIMALGAFSMETGVHWREAAVPPG